MEELKRLIELLAEANDIMSSNGFIYSGDPQTSFWGYSPSIMLAPDYFHEIFSLWYPGDFSETHDVHYVDIGKVRIYCLVLRAVNSGLPENTEEVA